MLYMATLIGHNDIVQVIFKSGASISIINSNIIKLLIDLTKKKVIFNRQKNNNRYFRQLKIKLL
jgi:hypothetical protein